MFLSCLTVISTCHTVPCGLDYDFQDPLGALCLLFVQLNHSIHLLSLQVDHPLQSSIFFCCYRPFKLKFMLRSAQIYSMVLQGYKQNRPDGGHTRVRWRCFRAPARCMMVPLGNGYVDWWRVLLPNAQSWLEVALHRYSHLRSLLIF